MISNIYFSKQRDLLRYLKADAGCRVGEAAVCSRKVHMVDPYHPEIVTVVSNADAGQVFYKRRRPGEIIHMDIFHEVGKISPQPIAQAVRKGIEHYAQHVTLERGYEEAKNLHQLAHFFDVQTGTGGGRVTGSQLFGQKESVKKAHLNHVHLSGKLGDHDLAAVFFIVAAVEREILRQGLELRRIELLQHEQNQFTTQYEDLSPYTAFTDSFLREQPPLSDDQAYGYELAMVADIMESLNDLQELSHMLKEVQAGGRLPSGGTYGSCWQDTWIKVEGYGLVSRQGNRYRLTEAGLELSRRLLVNAREIETSLRQQSILWAKQAGRSGGNLGAPYGGETVRRGLTRRKVVPWRGEFLAVSPTIINAFTRSGLLRGEQWSIAQEDLRFEQRQARSSIDICLLLDASASMLGKRIKAAKNLAEHLVQNSRDRISVITFQEQAVNVVVPFTRNRLLIRRCLDTIKPGGLTPLAAGLRKATDHIRAQCRRPGLLLLVTDGIPTLGEKEVDPLQDALVAARDFRAKTNFHLCCIGLQPNHNILRKVVGEAAGSLHIIEELDAASLLRIAASERNKAGQ